MLPIRIFSLLLLYVFSLVPFQTLYGVDFILLPDGFNIVEYVSGLDRPRFMAISPDKALFVADMGNGKVLALPDQDQDGKSEGPITLIEGLKRPNSLAFHDGYIYVAETDKVSRFKYNGFDKEPGKKEIIVSNLPNSGHFTKTVYFLDDKMYLSIGSSCNICVEKDKRRATILRFNPDGSDEEIFATGLRNSVGLTVHPQTKELWATDNGRDWLGDNLPPDEVNIIKKQNDYGWPYCYGDKIADPEFDNPKRCEYTIAPAVEIQAHSAPLGLTFYDGEMFPKEYKGDLFIAYHGSWNRSVPTGYKVVRVKIKDGNPAAVEDFAKGWIKDRKKLGRPVDVLVGLRGELYISDDFAGKIYRVMYESDTGIGE